MANHSFIQRKVTKTATLNLVSLMDIFTILVFFLLMNTGDSQELEKANFVKLPDSNAEGALHGELVINVGSDFIMIDNQKITEVASVDVRPGEVNKPLAEALQAFIEKSGEKTEVEKRLGRAVTIMGDHSVPYDLLKAVMTTCSAYDFRDISLAVNQVAATALSAGGR
ncbi:MAG: biopolymer transporter ExbD [Oceanospirillaceae bacterium]|nr:biopolymer transporter ExbD [Oceanospirillaceae bacterium]